MLTPANFHNYQKKGIAHSMDYIQSMLWLFLGAGKTVVSLTAIQERMDRGQVYGTLVIGPLWVVKTVWEEQINTWSHTRHLKSKLIHGSAETKIRAIDMKRPKPDVYLINYEGLPWLADYLVSEYLSKGKPLPFNMIVADEVTNLKNAQTLRHTQIRKFLQWCPYRIGLSATPASNGYKDLFGQYLAIDGGQRLGLVEKDFRQEYFTPTGYMGKDVKLKGTGKDRLLSSISDMTLQMDVDDYLKLPPVTYQDVWIPMEGQARKRYEKMEKELFVELDHNDNVEIANASGLSNKCLQFSSGAVYLTPGETPWAQVHKLKVDALADLVGDAGHNPVLVFYQFRHDRERILKKFPNAEFIVSSFSDKKANDIINRWNAGLIEMLIGHPGSMGHGLNLQGCPDSTIVWFGLPWRLDYYLQANGRIAKRQGVKHHVVVTRLLMIDTLDEAVAIAIKGKAETEDDLRKSVGEYRKNKLQLH